MDDNSSKISRAVFEKAITFVLAGFGFVSALAWNDAIQFLFTAIFGSQGTLIAKFGYAIVVTIVVTLVTIRLSRYISEQK